MDEQVLKIIRKDLGEIVEVVGAFKQDKNKCKPIRVTFFEVLCAGQSLQK